MEYDTHYGISNRPSSFREPIKVKHSKNSQNQLG